MSTSLEINIKADEWLDITTTEELLQNDVERLRETLRVRTAELDASNQLTADLSKHTYTLEKERGNLHKELKESHEDFANVDIMLKETVANKGVIEQEYNASKAASAARIESLEHELLTTNNSFTKIVSDLKNKQKALEASAKILEQEAITTENRASKVLSDLKNKLATAETVSKAQKEVIGKTRSNLDAVRKELATEKKASSLSSVQLELANGRLGSVAVLAEDRKDEKSSLQRSVAKQELFLSRASTELQRCAAQIASLQKELSDVKSVSDKRIEDLESSVGAHQKDLQGARDEIKVQQDSFESTLKVYEDTCKQISGLKEEVESTKGQTSVLQEELKESRSQEGAVRDELKEQKVAYEHRLNEIREALGVKKSSGDQNGIQPFKSLSLMFSGPV